MGLNIKQCRQCRKLFESFGSVICPECAEELDRSFQTVKNYLYDHPDANVFEITKETGVAEKIVLSFLKEGRLSMNTTEGILVCEKCGMPISAGRFCSDCQNMLESALSSAYRPEQEKRGEMQKTWSPGRMHVNHHR